MSATPAAQRTAERIGRIVVRVGIGVVLLIAAVLKAKAVVLGLSAEDGILSSNYLVVPLIAAEAVLGGMLLAGVHLAAARWAATACFTGFIVVSVHKGILGAQTCGCFGTVAINPWYMAAFDILTLLALVWHGPAVTNGHRERLYKARLLASLAPALLIGGAASLLLISERRSSQDEDPFARHSYAVVRPERYLGKRWPLIRYTNVSQQISRGRWVVVLFDYDCPDCRQALPQYRRLASTSERTGSDLSVALIEIPPYASGGRGLASAAGRLAYGRLSESKTWFVRTPVAFWMVDGKVQQVRQGMMQ